MPNGESYSDCSNEVWMVSEYGRFLGGALWSVVATGDDMRIVAECKCEEDARRIAVCVNAMHGIADPKECRKEFDCCLS